MPFMKRCSIFALKTTGLIIERTTMSFASSSFTVLSFRNALDVPSIKIPTNGITFVLYVLPPLVCYFVVAVLAITPHTRTARVVLCPPTASLALRAALSMGMSLGKTERAIINAGFVVSVFRTDEYPERPDLHRFPSRSSCFPSPAVPSAGHWRKGRSCETSVLRIALRQLSWTPLILPQTFVVMAGNGHIINRISRAKHVQLIPSHSFSIHSFLRLRMH